MNFLTVFIFLVSVIYFTGCATNNHPNDVKIEVQKTNLFSKNDK